MIPFGHHVFFFFPGGVPGDVFWWMIFCCSNMETYNIFEICTFCTVDGSEILHQLRLAVYLIIYKVLYIHPRWLFWISFINSSINVSTFCVATNHGDVDLFFCVNMETSYNP